MEAPGIRKARMADCQAVEACVRAAYARYLTRMDKQPAPLHADYAALIARGAVSVLTDGEAVRGVLVMMAEGRSMFVENIAVDPRYQGRGLGRMLMAFVERQARVAGINEIHLYTNEVMTENLRFYHRLGFEEEGRRTQDGFRRVFLRKLLV